MLVGYIRVSTNGDRQVLDLRRDALLAAGVDERHLFEDRATGSRDDRTGLAKALAFIRKLDRLGRRCLTFSPRWPTSSVNQNWLTWLRQAADAGSRQAGRAMIGLIEQPFPFKASHGNLLADGPRR